MIVGLRVLLPVYEGVALFDALAAVTYLSL